MKARASFLSKRLAAWRRLHESDVARFGESDARSLASRAECLRLAAGLIGGFEVAA